MKPSRDVETIEALASGPGPLPTELGPPGPRRRWVIGVVAGALAVIAVGVALAGGDELGRAEVRSSTRVTAPPRNWDAECDNDGDSRTATASELPPELLYYPGYVPAGLSLRTPAAGSIWPDHLGCHHGGVALVLAETDPEDDDRVVRSLQVSGPSFQPRRPNFDQREAETAVRVRGGEGVWRTWGEPAGGTLLWADPEGGEWTLIGARNREEALAVIAGLRIDLDIDGPPVVADDIPDGLDVLWQRPEQEGAGYDQDTHWSLTFYGPEGPHSPSSPPMPSPVAPGEPVEPVTPPYDGPPLSIGVERMSTPGTALANAYTQATLTEIRGRRGLEQTDPNGNTSLTWDEEYGITVRVSGSVGPDELRKVAESVRPIDPDDPRLH